MKLRNYRDDLFKRLANPQYAADYLEQTLATGDNSAFLVVLKDVVDAHGGVGDLANTVRVTRLSLYKILSKGGNPTVEMLQHILRPLGLRVSITLEEAA